MSTHNEETQVRAVIEDWALALGAKDTRRVLSHYGKDVVQFTLAPPLVSDEGAAELKVWFDSWQGPIGYELRDLIITARSDIAFGHGLTRLTGTSTGGEKTDLWFRLTLGLRKIGSAWKIIHAHESVPFYMDGSYRAAIDLKPQGVKQ
ncbi:MAG: YybH family protein [Methyloceanibacter sp.]|uniref:YybH family protein n=1 Tax=Methyloceanibacter sp. TaxID=1965321 RepID=UPI003D6C8A83